MRLVVNGWFLNQPHTGSGQYVRQLLVHLFQVAPEHEYLLVTPEAEFWCTPDKAPHGEVWPWIDGPQRRALGPGKVWFEQVTFPRACRRLGADLAHVPYWAPPLASTVPTLVTIHDLIPALLPRYRRGIGVRLYVGLVSRTAARADLVLTDSQASRQDILTHLGLPEERVRAIWLATDAAFVPQPRPDDRAIRAQYGLPDEYVLYLGGFDPRKNVGAVLRAWRRARPALDPGTRLVVAGRLPPNSTFDLDPRQAARELDLDPQSLIFPGFVAEAHKPAVYRGALFFVFPSRYEGFGLPPLEALSCGLPVIGSRLSSLPEVIGEGGLLFEPDDVPGMAEAMVSLVTDPARRAMFGERALAQAARFSWSETARQTLACYQEVKL